MKKQINPSIKASLNRSAFYLLLLLGVCAIPFALAQRQATKRAVAQSRSRSRTLPRTSRRLPRPPPERFPPRRCRTFLKPGSRSFRRLQMSALLHSQSLAPQHRRANEEAISASFARVAHAFINGSACLIIQSVLRGVTHRELS